MGRLCIRASCQWHLVWGPSYPTVLPSPAPSTGATPAAQSTQASQAHICFVSLCFSVKSPSKNLILLTSPWPVLPRGSNKQDAHNICSINEWNKNTAGFKVQWSKIPLYRINDTKPIMPWHPAVQMTNINLSLSSVFLLSETYENFWGGNQNFYQNTSTFLLRAFQ